MKPLFNILRKEVKELVTPGTFIPVIVVAIVFASLGGVIGGIAEGIDSRPTIGVYDMDNSELSEVVVASLQSTSTLLDLGPSTELEDMLEVVKNNEGAALIIIPEGFSATIESNAQGQLSTYYVMNSAGLLDTIPTAMVSAVLAQASSDLSKSLLSNVVSNTTISIDVLQNPIYVAGNINTYFDGQIMENISPDMVSASLSSNSFIVPFIVMMIVVMAGSIVISSMGMEKENKTLETLLTMPVRRTDIVIGKLGAAAIVGLLMAIIYMVGMMVYMNSLISGSQVDLAQYGISLGLVDYLLLGVSLFLAILFALSLCMVLGIFAKDYKSAQSLTMPITFLAMIPFFITMFVDFGSLPFVGQAFVFAIPFSHPMMAMNNLMLGNYSMVLAGIAYEAVFAAVMILIATYLFKKDILITGRTKKNKPQQQDEIQ